MKPREYTEYEVRNQFLDHIRAMITYWHDLPDKTVRERMEGLAFSTLVLLDGGTEMPGFIVAPCPHESDKEYHQGQEENWFPENHESKVNCDIAGSLHDNFYKR